jgi:hypothetical protein
MIDICIELEYGSLLIFMCDDELIETVSILFLTINHFLV